MVTGKVIWLTEYPSPFQFAEETVISEPPAVNVPVRSLLLPTLTLPKFMLEGLTPNWPGANPSPVRGTVAGEPPSIEMVSVPFTVPADLGAKVTLKVADWPGSSVKGHSGVLVAVKPGPLTLICETVTLEPAADALLTVRVLVLLLPTATPPKSTDELVSVRLGLKVFDVPVPPPPQELASEAANRVRTMQ